ncbi:(2E,6E)-farnesyl diphosphate synthase [Mycobacterium marinum]|uniref:geranylgeranyl diphosphate synthase IdsB n=1 Tax=Mycobacterium marinum TaxID=1781 RepID=UPI000E3E31C0|nr:geranylgeranyl diphosphate synthase IdsB [Mycobacterium marinum]RFZ15681.1 (2E,6E)-farnesyl diphosphate synthase [Mycobacterium marinum]
MTADGTCQGDVPAEVVELFLSSARAACDPVLRRAVESMPEPLATMAGYHLGWWDADRSPLAGSSGTFIRAALVWAAAAACGGDTGDAAPIAAAVELVHSGTLLHDDVMASDAARGGIPTVWSVWGVDNAILLGNAFQTAAIWILTGLGDPSVAVRAVIRLETSCLDLCIERFEDCAFECGQAGAADSYERMAAGKAAALIGCCCGLGALAADAGDATIAALERFGRELGLALQCVNDLDRRNATLTVAAALNSRSEVAIEPAVLCQSSTSTKTIDIDRGATLVDVAAGRHVVRRCADQRIQAAVGALPDAVRSRDLTVLSQLICHRER